MENLDGNNSEAVGRVSPVLNVWCTERSLT
jgi:hypothetical protein